MPYSLRIFPTNARRQQGDMQGANVRNLIQINVFCVIAYCLSDIRSKIYTNEGPTYSLDRDFDVKKFARRVRIIML